MNLLFEDGFCLNSFELGFEILANVGAGVTAATWVCHAEGSVVDFVTREAPVALSAAILLGLGGISVGMAGFGEVARKVLLGFGGAIDEAGVVAVSELVGSSHND